MKKDSLRRLLKLLVVLLCGGALVAVDQAVKLWAVDALKGQSPIVVIKDIFVLSYAENTGAAFSSFTGMRWFLVVMSAGAALLILWMLWRGTFKGALADISLTIILAGDVGNLVDRLRDGFVVDLFYVEAINFPVFNVADICVTVGAVLLAVYVLLTMLRERREKGVSSEGSGDEAS